MSDDVTEWLRQIAAHLKEHYRVGDNLVDDLRECSEFFEGVIGPSTPHTLNERRCLEILRRHPERWVNLTMISPRPGTRERT